MSAEEPALTTAERSPVRFEPRWRFQILVPLRFNKDDPVAPGQPIPRAEFDVLEERLLTRYRGITMTRLHPPSLEGAWVSLITGQRFDDVHRGYEILCVQLPEHEAYFLALHAELCERLRQEDIFITRQEIELATQRRR